MRHSGYKPGMNMADYLTYWSDRWKQYKGDGHFEKTFSEVYKTGLEEKAFEDEIIGEKDDSLILDLMRVALRVDPLKPHDFFDLEGKMAGSGGGKTDWSKVFGKQKQLSEQQVKTADNVIQKIQHKTRLQLQEKGILDTKGKLTQKSINECKEVPLQGNELKNPQVIEELTKNGTKIEDWKKMETIESIILPNGNKAKVHFYKNTKTGEVNTNIDFKLKGNVPLDKGFQEL
jgi:hypothetical protein